MYVFLAHCWIDGSEDEFEIYVPDELVDVRLDGKLVDYRCLCRENSLFPRFANGCLSCIQKRAGTQYPNYAAMARIRDYCRSVNPKPPASYIKEFTATIGDNDPESSPTGTVLVTPVATLPEGGELAGIPAI